jgi:hypothetical protein
VHLFIIIVFFFFYGRERNEKPSIYQWFYCLEQLLSETFSSGRFKILFTASGADPRKKKESFLGALTRTKTPRDRTYLTAKNSMQFLAKQS